MLSTVAHNATQHMLKVSRNSHVVIMGSGLVNDRHTKIRNKVRTSLDSVPSDDRSAGIFWGYALVVGYTVLLRSIRPSRVPGLGGLDEIGPRSQVTAHLARQNMVRQIGQNGPILSSLKCFITTGTKLTYTGK